MDTSTHGGRALLLKSSQKLAEASRLSIYVFVWRGPKIEEKV